MADKKTPDSRSALDKIREMPRPLHVPDSGFLQALDPAAKKPTAWDFTLQWTALGNQLSREELEKILAPQNFAAFRQFLGKLGK